MTGADGRGDGTAASPGPADDPGPDGGTEGYDPEAGVRNWHVVRKTTLLCYRRVDGDYSELRSREDFEAAVSVMVDASVYVLLFVVGVWFLDLLANAVGAVPDDAVEYALYGVAVVGAGGVTATGASLGTAIGAVDPATRGPAIRDLHRVVGFALIAVGSAVQILARPVGVYASALVPDGPVYWGAFVAAVVVLWGIWAVVHWT